MQVATGRDIIRYKRYTVQDGLSHRMISGMMQDSVGNLWLSTWNGLCKFDGETFSTYNETSEDEKVGRLGLVRMTTEGKIWVIRQSDSQEFFFNPKTKLLDRVGEQKVKLLPVARLSPDNAPDSTGLKLIHDSITYCIPYEGAGMTNNSHFNSFVDRQGNIWANFDDALYQITFDKATYEHIGTIDPQHKNNTRYVDEIRAIIQLRDGGFLLACKNKCIYKYNANWQFEGYLTSQGNVVSTKTAFCNQSIYCMKQSDDGSVWLGSRGEGLFHISSPLLDQQSKEISIQNYKEETLGSSHIFDLAFINSEELVVATWDGGVQILKIIASGQISCSAINEKIRKTRRIFVIKPNLIALCSTQGIYLVDKGLNELKHLGTMDVSDLCQADNGIYYLSTLSSGIFTFKMGKNPGHQELDSIKLEELDIKGIDNVIISSTKTNDGLLWFISDNRIFKFNPILNTTQIIDRHAIGSEVIFGEAQPLVLDDQLIMGTNIGRMQIDLTSPKGYCPQLQLNTADTIEMEWGKNAPEIRAIALDFRLPRLIQYAWRELPDSTWTMLEENGRLTLDKLWPGSHRFEIRSTDAKGIWADNARVVTVIVRPALWQRLLLWSCILLILSVCYWIWKLNRYQTPKSATVHPIATTIQPSQPVVVYRDQQFIEQVTKIVEEHIDDPMLDVEMMTNYMNTSRTILYAKFKELLDTTPALFITEIRLKRAIQLLDSRQYRISEIAAMCGFSDPKYFARHFKQRMGKTPAKYLEEKDTK